MQRIVSRAVATLSLLLAAALLPATALAALERVGPTSPVHGFPEWFQDTTGVTLEFCTPLNQAELDGGWCLLLPGDISETTPELPEIFPTRFAGEHFWWAGEVATDWNTPAAPGANQPRVRLVLGLEAAFATGETATPGDQVVFGRLRIRVDDIPVTGDYRFITPYGTWTFHGTAGERIFETRDIGLSCAVGDFSCALQSDLGPFLLPSDTAGGPELAPVTGPVPGKLYIADPGRIGPVTGSPVGVNYFRIEGPEGTVPFHTENFSLVGRLFDGTLPARAHVDRATYARTPDSQSVEAFATAFPTMPGRIPGSATPETVTPELYFFTAPCGGGEPAAGCEGNFCPLSPYTAPTDIPAIPMRQTGSAYWGKFNPAAVPPAVCVGYTNPKTGTGGDGPPLYMPAPLGDQVVVEEASYDPEARTLTVRAFSLDAVSNPSLEVASYGGEGPWALTAGQAVIADIDAPPASVRIVSAEGGSNELQVTTGAISISPPVAVADLASTPYGQPVTVAVLANDSDPDGDPLNVSSVSQPANGTVQISADRQTVTFTPALFFIGTDAFTYTITDGRGGFAAATVSVTVGGAANVVPVANPDSGTTPLNTPITIAVLANDMDPNGDALTVVGVTQPVGGLAVHDLTSVTFVPADGVFGTTSFVYTVSDGRGGTANGLVTVTVRAAETLLVTRAQFRTPNEWRVEGTSTAEGALVTVHAGSTLAGDVIGTATVEAGIWSVRTTASGVPSNTRVSIESTGGAVRLNQQVTIR